ncbi:MAG: hypothetical protein A3F74_23785 [Betaproteobacteria bacterium RIFCSPLOWO2_12_FULL_62_58]|nr:MAG: hypothetical protein A3I62_04380 [Betaproteobacteria bacterium RIFCSPLOWO2_02_FULL_62_79]OGA47395.1 MAG: hypothetical protein A3F74_23785 [Betaproteobacteria bacterium RIFCSPLOWO2_12_FULL_62_58]
MAAVFFPTAFNHGVSGGQRLSTAQARFALALAASACLHFWLAAGMAVDAPERAPSPAARILTAQLEPVPAPPILEAQPEREPALADPAEPRSLRARSPPHPEHVSPATKRSEPPAASPGAIAGAALPSAFVLPSTADRTYYPARELDVYPAPRAPLSFEYPERAAREQVGGSVRIMLLLDEAGAVDSVSVVAAEPPGYFEDSVRGVFAATRFFPARKDGRAVKSRVLINVEFDSRAAAGTLR